MPPADPIHPAAPPAKGSPSGAPPDRRARLPWPLRRRERRRKTLWESVRETLDSILIALVLASVFRTFIMEAFEIPTGSMAPTLYGRHVDVRCPTCGYFFSVGLDRRGEGVEVPGEIVCPMCGTRMRPRRGPAEYLPPEVVALDRLRGIGGDRILVDKWAYTLGNPRRWEVGVFVNPHNHSENYIKRVVGLPGERVRIRHGDLYINGRIARKPDRVQEVLWQPVFDSDYPPNGSWQRPWPPGAPLPVVRSHTVLTEDGRREWLPPWRPVEAVGRWDLAGKTFRYTPDPGDTRPSRIRFTWKVYDTYGYGQRMYRGVDYDPISEVGDVRLRATVTLSRPGLVLARIVEDGRRLDYLLSADPAVPSSVSIDGKRVLWSVGGAPLLEPGRPVKVAFVNVDDRAWLEVAGRRPLGIFDYADWETSSSRQDDEGPSKAILVGAAASPVRFAHLRIDRDIYYTRTVVPGEAYAVKGEQVLGPGEYFVLGDNSPRSRDSRRWWKGTAHPSPAVPRENFIGKANLLYWPHREKLWRIHFIR